MTPGALHDTARRVARARWFELRCFEVLGRWVPSTPEPDVKIALARQSHHHAWHAELFERVQPSANGFAPGAPELDPGPEWPIVVERLAALPGTAERLEAAYGLVLPGKVAEYEGWLEQVDPVADAPLRRWLTFVVADEHADLEEGRRLLRDHGSTSVAGALGPLEAALRGAGRLLG